MDDELYENLKKIFNNDVNLAIEYSESIIWEKKSENLKNKTKIKVNYNKNICTYSWTKESLSIRCYTCGKSPYSCMCLDCFNKGNHEGHHYKYIISCKGTCDCGDQIFLKEEGFCPLHGNKTDEEKVLTSEEKKRNVAIFAAAINNFPHLAINSPNEFVKIASWILNIAESSEEMRHCIVTTFINYFDIASFVFSVPNASFEVSNVTDSIFTILLYDEAFKEHFLEATFPLIPKFTSMMFGLPNSQIWNITNHTLEKIMYEFNLILNSINEKTVRHLIDIKADWSGVILETIRITIENVTLQFSYSVIDKNDIFLAYPLLSKIISIIKEIDSAKEDYDSFVLSFIQIVAKLEGILPVSRKFGNKTNDFLEKQLALVSLTDLLGKLAVKIVKDEINKDAFIFFSDFLQDQILSDAFDSEANDDTIMLFRSILAPNANISMSLTLHNYIVSMMLKQGTHLKEKMENLCNDIEFSIDFFTQCASILPLRYITASVQCEKHFVRNSESFITALLSLKCKWSIKNRFIPLFSMIQLCLGLTYDKDSFILMIAKTFGLFDDNLETEIKQTMEFSFIHFIVCLIYDRVCITKDYHKLIMSHILALLQKGPMSLSDINNEIWRKELSNDDFLEEIFKHGQRFESNSKNFLRADPNDKWSPFLPWLTHVQILDIITAYLSANPNKQIPFPDYEPNSFNLDFRETLSSPSLLAIEYSLLSNSVCKESIVGTAHIVFGLIKEFSKVSENDSSEELDKEIIADNLSELSETIPCTFHKFMFTPISYKGRGKESVVTLISKHGKVGEDFLIDLNIGYTPKKEEGKSSAEKEERKKRSKEMKRKALSELQQQKSAFSENIYLEKEEETCSICSLSKGVLCFPVNIYSSSLYDVINSNFYGITKERYKPAIHFNLCTHLIHNKCAGEINERRFRCPVCRKKIVALLPKLNGFDSLSQDEISSLKMFMRISFSNKYKRMIKSLSSTIGLAEIRYRTNKEFIHQETFKALLRNVFLSIWHFVRIFNIDVHKYSFEDPLERVFNKLVESSNPKEDILGIIKEEEIESNKLLEFLRRISFIEHFCLETECLDIERLLEAENLSKRYETSVDFCDLPVFKLIDLPNEFIKLQSDPYNINIADQSSSIAICLLTGQIVRLVKYGVIKYPYFVDYSKNVLRGIFAPFMVLTGEYATQTFVYMQSKYMNTTLGIYVNVFGETDVGFKIGRPLKLSKEKIEKLIDVYLSGDWMDCPPFVM